MQSNEESENDGFARYCGISPKFRQIIRHQGGKEFSAFFKAHALQIETKADLYEVLSHFRAGLQCARALCRGNSLSMCHNQSQEAYQEKQIQIILPELRAQPHLAFPMTQRLVPGAIRQFLQAGSIVAYTHALAEKAVSVTKDSVDGYLARVIMTTGLALASIFDECHPYLTIFLNVVERLVGRLLVHEGTLALEKKDRSAFYEKNLDFMGLAAAPSGKSLKHLQ